MDLSRLNGEQLAAVKDTEGAVLVLAGAGSGKTTVLTNRIAYLISECGVDPYNILAITFTNKAAAEMTTRVQRLTDTGRVWTSTFHSLCAKILRYDIDKLGYTSDFSIYDESYQKHTLKRILKEKRIEDDKLLSSVAWHIGNAKNEGLTPEEYEKQIGSGGKNETIIEVYSAYEDAMRRANALDFDDLLMKTLQLFEEFPTVLEKYRTRFRYLLVDEFQDTNAIQLRLVKMIAGEYGNIFAVGDDDQSIYGWRGADISNILDFEKKFKNVKIHKLEQNYRSTNAILNVANNLIKNNDGRHEKKLWSELGQGARVEYQQYFDDKEEARVIVDNLRSLRYHFGYEYSDMAILVRLNAITRNFENRLSEAGIPYKLYGGFKFFDRKEILDVIAYLRAVKNPRDNEAFARIINFPARGIGESTVQALFAEAYACGEDVGDVILRVESSSLTPAQKKKIGIFRDVYSKLISSQNMGLTDFVSLTIEEAGFEKIYTTGEEEDYNRLLNLQEFVSAVKEFEEKNENATLSLFLQNLALASDNEEESGNCVTLSTVHAAKGLEYKAVFIAGVEEDIFPSAMCRDNPDELEEERRVMYVAVTRARERLQISSVRRRARFGKYVDCRVSRFVAEMKGVKQELPVVRSFDDRYDSYDRLPEAPTAASKIYTFTKPVAAKPTISIGKFKTGTRVNHKSFGDGYIVEIKGEGKNRIAVVAFKNAGIKSLALSVAPLTVLD